VEDWPQLDVWTSGVQLIRAVESIGANIAEASGRATKPDRRRILTIARGSLSETRHWLALAERRSLVPLGTHERTRELTWLLDGLIRRPGGV
jgi:four helix bundle protein